MIQGLRSYLLLFLICAATVASKAQYNQVFVFLHKRTDLPVMPKEQVDKIMEGHMANINRLAKEGKLLAAGPFEGGGGIFIFSSNSIETVSEWLASDPGVKAERWRVELQPFYGRIGKVALVNEPYEMVMYTFVRFTPNIAKFNIQELPEIFLKHDNYLKQLNKTGNVVGEGVFGDTEGGVLIMKGEVQPSVFETDPAVQEGLLQLDFKKLFIAKGVFGER
ncbi:MAG: YciI family protein [Flammeovirgaceae bacterium]